jgi:hypothetical protein
VGDSDVEDKYEDENEELATDYTNERVNDRGTDI